MFCTNCGRLLKDGEICECQKQESTVANADAVIENAAAQADATINSAPQAQFNSSYSDSDETVLLGSVSGAASAGLGAAQATSDRANQYFQQYSPQNESQAPSGQTLDGQFTQPQGAQFSQGSINQGQAQFGQQSNQFSQNNIDPNRTQFGAQPQFNQSTANPSQAQFGQQGNQFVQNNMNPNRTQLGGQPQFNQAMENQGQPQYGQPQTQYGQPQGGQFGQNMNNQGQPQYGQPQGGQFGNNMNNQGQPQYGQPQYGQPQNQYGQQQFNRANQSNPYGNNAYNQTPPSYYNQQPYMSDDERLRKYMSSPKFVAARDFMCSMPVLLYAISVSAILIFYVATMSSVLDLLHPLYILLCIGAWITFASGLKSKKNNVLPSTSGLSIGSGVAITMLVLWCIGFGLVLLVMIISVFSVLSMGGSARSAAVIALFIMLVITILILVLGIKYYSLQSRSIKGIKFCITNEANPSRFSIFPAVILIIAAIITVISIIGTQSLLGNAKLKSALTDYLMEYFKNSGIDKISSGTSKQLTEWILDTIYSTKGQIIRIVGSALDIFNLISTALIFITAKSKLNKFSDL